MSEYTTGTELAQQLAVSNLSEYAEMEVTEFQRSRGSTSDLFGHLQLREYLDIGYRRRSWIVLTTVAICVASCVVAIRLPSIYKSQTVILVDPQKVPGNLVSSLVSTSFEDRLARIQQQILSPAQLSKLIDALKLYPELRGKLDNQELVARMQKAITVETVSQAGRPVNAFRISYHGKNAVEVARVTNQLASMFIEQNLEVRDEQSQGTTEFLENELEKTKKALTDKEAELRKVKSENIMALPDSKSYHIQALESLRSQLRASQDRVDRDQQQKIYLQSTAAAPTINMDEGASPYEARIMRLESELSQLRARYGPKHPDVRKVQAELDAIREKQQEQQKVAPALTDAPTPRSTVRNPVLAAQLQKIDDDIQKELRVQSDLQKQIDTHVSDLQKEPIFETQITGLMRDYDTLRTHYTTLLDKKLAADMGNSLENRQKGERFVILDPAQISDKPFGPNRLLICLAGLVGGLMGGIGLAIAAEMADDSVRGERELASTSNIPVLAGIPTILTAREMASKRLHALVAIAGTTVGSLAVGFAVAALTQRFL